MKLDIFATLDSDSHIKIYDVSSSKWDLPSTINTMSLDISSSRIPNGRIDAPLDIMTYLRMKRVRKEIYTISSETLGLYNSVIIPDGVYHFTYNINNTFSTTKKFLVFATVKKEVEKLLKEVNYNVEIGDYDISYVGDYSEYDIEKIRLAHSLYDSLLHETQDPDEVAVNNTLDKLSRLLELINNDLNN
ncbi:MAG: hypothetical protein GY775_19315 [Candidatus Scalindua sp.]|nr:hypothetical protein [Candidatus Scalindua sp.]